MVPQGSWHQKLSSEQARPSTQTDLYSLAVLLFYILMIHHPLEGQQETQIACLDAPAMTRLYGEEALFIFDPHNPANRPLPGYHDNAITYWQIYPQFLRDLFIKAFTKRDSATPNMGESASLNGAAQWCACGMQSSIAVIVGKRISMMSSGSNNQRATCIPVVIVTTRSGYHREFGLAIIP